MIPRTQQGTSLWNFQVKYGGLPPYTDDQLITLAGDLGLGYLDLLAPEQIQVVRASGTGLKVGSAVFLDYDGKGTPPFWKGPNHKQNHDLFVERTTQLIDGAADSGICNCVTVFFGDHRVDPTADGSPAISLSDGIANCVTAYQKVVGHAERRGVTLALELLNDHDRGHDMKGHPGYQGNSMWACLEVIEKVGSPALKLLFDIYHVALMEPSKTVPEWIRELGTDMIGHVHTAGYENRQETYLDRDVDQKACAQALHGIGWTGPVIHEYLPTVENIRQGLDLSVRWLSGE